jgi:hypothetical protein
MPAARYIVLLTIFRQWYQRDAPGSYTTIRAGSLKS